MRFALLNASSDAAITKAVLLQIAAALTIQIARDYAPMWQAAPVEVCVVDTAEAAPSDACLVRILDTLPAQGALGYHDTDASGRPEALIGWGVIKANGGTLTSGPNSLSATISHEVLEALGDTFAGQWNDMTDGKTEVAYEIGDPVEGDGYPITVPADPVGAPAGATTQVWVSNFVGPRYFDNAGGPGPYDFLNKLTAPLSMDAGGYQILRTGGPAGQTQDVFAREAHEGGMPLWKRELKKHPSSRRSRRHRRPQAEAA